MSESKDSSKDNKVNRRGFLKYAVGGAVAVAIAAGGAYVAMTPAPSGVTTNATSAATSVPMSATSAVNAYCPPPDVRGNYLCVPGTWTGGGPGGVDIKVATAPVTMAKDWKRPEYGAQVWAKTTGNTVTVIEIPAGVLYEKYMADLVSGFGAYDIMMWAGPWWGDMMPYMMPLDKYLQADPQFNSWNQDDLPVFLKMTQYGNETRSLRIDGDNFSMYNNLKAFNNSQYQQKFKAKYGYDLAYPTTWNQYLDIAQFFNGWDWFGDGNPHIGCAEITARDGAYNVWTFLPRFASACIPKYDGAIYFDPDTMAPLINSPPGKRAMENLLASSKFMGPGASAIGFEDCSSDFLNGTAAMTINWPDMGPRSADPNTSKIVGSDGYSVTPGWEDAWDFNTQQWIKNSADDTVTGRLWNNGIHYGTMLGYGWSLSIPATCKNPDIAVNLLKWMIAPENEYNMVIDGWDAMDPVRKSVWTPAVEQTIKNAFPIPYTHLEDYLTMMQQSDNFGIADLRIPKTEVFYNSLAIHISNVLSGIEDVETSLKSIESDWSFQISDMGTDVAKKAYLISLGIPVS